MPVKQPLISFVVAWDQNGVIGRDGALPWRLPDDMKRFREITMGHPVLMGRKTYESLPAQFRPLPGRWNIVLTHQQGYDAPGCTVVNSLEQALALLADTDEVMVIGGAELFAQLLQRAGRLYLTEVQGEFAGDVTFPALNAAGWQEVAREEHVADERHAVPFSFVILEPRQPR
jgi:dihydrofolate reductase